MDIDIQKNANNTETTINPEADLDHAGATTVDRDAEEGAEMLEDRIRALEEELQDYKDRFLRNLAEMENMRRRQERERQDLLKYAAEKLLQDLLPVLDSFEKASATLTNDAASAMVEGVRMVHKQFLQVLDNHGVKAVEAVGNSFDPNIHQAIQRIEIDSVSKETVKDEFQRGYTLNGRLVRPSMVSVLVPKVGTAGTP